MLTHCNDFYSDNTLTLLFVLFGRYIGDAHTTLETALCNVASARFYTKWLQDILDIQGFPAHSAGANDPGGYIAHTAPTIDGGGGPAWSGFVVVMPWEVQVNLFYHCCWLVIILFSTFDLCIASCNHAIRYLHRFSLSLSPPLTEAKSVVILMWGGVVSPSTRILLQVPADGGC
jgi:hypothetical protein